MSIHSLCSLTESEEISDSDEEEEEDEDEDEAFTRGVLGGF